jgi:hypothetical protein
MASNFSAAARRRLIWQYCYWLALAAIFSGAAWLRFALPLDPLADPDTWGYLSPALRKLTGAEFGHTYGRNFVYPGFVFLILRTFGDFRAITLLQHLLGLAAGGLLLLTWRRARVFVANPRLRHDVYDAFGLIAAAIFLFAGETIHLEMQLRPEGVCAFLLSLNVWVAIQFAVASYIDNRRLAATAYGAALVVSSVLLASVKPSFALVAIITVFPVAIFSFRRDWLREKLVLVTGALVGATLLLVPEHFLSRGDEQSRTFLPTTLFVIHANLIRDLMADDLQRDANLPYSRDWLARVHTALNAEIAKSATAEPRYHVSAGFSPDYLMYNPTSIAAQLRSEFQGNVAALCAFYRFYYWRIWLHRPIRVLEKIARQMSIFYAPMCPAYNRSKAFQLTSDYERGVNALDVASYRKVWIRYPPAVEFVSRTRLLARRAPAIEQPPWIRKPLVFLAAAYCPLLVASIAVSTFVFLRQRQRSRFGCLAGFVLFLFTCNFFACLEVAVVHLLEYSRYITVQMYFTLLAEFFALWLGVESVLEIPEHAHTTHN